HRRQRGRRLGAATFLIEQLARHRDAVLGGPLPQLDGVQVQPLVDAMRRQSAFLDPVARGVLVDTEVTGRLPEGQLHGTMRRKGWPIACREVALVPRRATMDEAAMSATTGGRVFQCR